MLYSFTLYIESAALLYLLSIYRELSIMLLYIESHIESELLYVLLSICAIYRASCFTCCSLYALYRERAALRAALYMRYIESELLCVLLYICSIYATP
jgi:hypothetical protein